MRLQQEFVAELQTVVGQDLFQYTVHEISAGCEGLRDLKRVFHLYGHRSHDLGETDKYHQYVRLAAPRGVRVKEEVHHEILEQTNRRQKPKQCRVGLSRMC